MAKILATIFAALMKIISPEPALQEDIALPIVPTIIQTESVPGAARLTTTDTIQVPAEKNHSVVPTLPPTPLPTKMAERTYVEKEPKISDEGYIVMIKEREEQEHKEVPCLGCKQYISPIPMPTRIITPTYTPRPTHEIKPTPTYYPTPFPTRFITPIYEWPEPTPCPSVSPHLDKLPEGTQINPIYTEPIYCLD